MLLHITELSLSPTTYLAQDAVGEVDLADVVEQGPEADQADGIGRCLHLLGQPRRHDGDVERTEIRVFPAGFPAVSSMALSAPTDIE